MTTTEVVNTLRQDIAKNFGGGYYASRGVNNVSEQQSFAEFVRRKMGSRSQRDLAHKIGVSPTTIGNYLLGRLPDLNDGGLLQRIAEALETSTDEVVAIVRAEQETRRQEAAIRAMPADPFERVRVALNGVDFMEDYQIERIKQLIEKHRKPK